MTKGNNKIYPDYKICYWCEGKSTMLIHTVDLFSSFIPARTKPGIYPICFECREIYDPRHQMYTQELDVLDKSEWESSDIDEEDDVFN